MTPGDGTVVRMFLGLWMLATCHAVSAEVWVSIGPFGTGLVNNDVIGGQVNALAVDPRDANVLFVGASEGGVWRTRDGGATWAPLTDTQLVRKLPSGVSKGTLSIGALAIDPARSQTIYAGTGDPNVACCFAGAALGVFRSTDSGNTWVPTGANLNQSGCRNAAMSQAVVNRILVVTRRPALVYAATNMGVFSYLEDGADCWRGGAKGLPASGNAIDLVADPYQAALYVAFRSQGIFKSENLGADPWRKLAGGLPEAGFGRIALAFGGRLGIGFSQPLPIVYAGFDAGNRYRLFRTANGGDQWTELPAPPSDGQLDFNNALAVGSYDSNEVYVGQVAFWRATDGGAKGGLNSYKVDPPITENSWTVLGCCLSHPNPFRKGLDLHGDIHDIVLAPYGSFVPSPSQVQIVYVATDGGVTKGSIDFEGVVSWEPLTAGLAIGQSGTIGMDPGNQAVTVSGLWHNGDILSLSAPPASVAITGGDGFQATIDAGTPTTYVNCNAGFGGDICRATPPPPLTTSPFGFETIWGDRATKKHWSDPHRPGNLLRLQAGLLYRTTVAHTAPASVLKTPDAWEAVDPFWGKTGQTTTVAFRSRVLEDTPIYYVGTTTGQIWRGSSEAGWTKLCECGFAVNAIATDLFRNERIFAVVMAPSSPGRVKELTRLPDGTWQTRNIDAQFTPELAISQITSVVVDPAVPKTRGTTIYVGSDQGVYRGHVDTLVLDPTVSAKLVLPPVIGDWSWRRSPGVPNVWVTDLEVHQNFAARDRSGIVRAGTYGRGIFELDRRGPAGKVPLTLTVHAIEVGKDGAPPPLNVRILASIGTSNYTHATPFEVAPRERAEIVLEAPREIRAEAAVLKFVGWAIPGQRAELRPTISLRLDQTAKAIAYYEKERRIPDPNARPLQVVASTAASAVCVPSFTHELTLSWGIDGGQLPVTARAEITFPDRHVESVGLKHLEGAQPFPVNFPKGGSVSVRVTATDSVTVSAAVESTLDLRPCPADSGARDAPKGG